MHYEQGRCIFAGDFGGIVRRLRGGFRIRLRHAQYRGRPGGQPAVFFLRRLQKTALHLYYLKIG